MKLKNEKLFIQIACLICSVGLWVLVMVKTNPILDETIKNVPVSIKNLSALESSNMILMNNDKDGLTINVKVKGTGEQLSKINKSDFTAYIDVLGLGEGTRNVKVEVSGPNEIEIGEHYPSQLACVVESVVSKVMDVDIQYEGSQAQNYFRASGKSNPSSVKITGPRSIVDSAKSVIATINVDGAKDSVVKTVPVRVYNGTDTEIFMSVPTGNVEVSVPIYPTKYVNIKPSITGEPLDGYKLVDTSVSPNRIKIAARRDILDSIKELEIEELDINGTYHNVMSSRKILNDSGFIVLGLDKDPVVNVVVEKIIQKELIYEIDEIEFTNIKDGYEINPINLNTSITVTIDGPDSAVNNFKKDELKLVVDLSEASLGDNKTTIKNITENKQVNVTLNTDTIDINIIALDSYSEEETNTSNTDNKTE